MALRNIVNSYCNLEFKITIRDFIVLGGVLILCEQKYIKVLLSILSTRSALTNYKQIEYLIYLINANILMYTLIMYFNTFSFSSSIINLYYKNYFLNFLILIFSFSYLIIKYKLLVIKYKYVLIILTFFLMGVSVLDLITFVFLAIISFISSRLTKFNTNYFSAIIFPMVLVYYIVFDKNIFSIVCTCLLLFSYLVPIILERKLNNEQKT